MKTAALSRDRELAEELLRYFVDSGSVQSFSAALLVCYDLLRPDVVLELAWKSKWIDYSFPYLIQVMREYTSKVDRLEAASRPPVDADGRPLPVPPGFVMPMMMPPPVPMPGGGPPPPYAMQPPGAVPPRAGFDPNDFSAFGQM